ncbi:Ni/Fe-hydrogenase subunit HybB-like protein [Sulfitobacter undariae]|uniref:Ni/Fe-hydrogenase subunit HybB-like protein n=1 Tax=Sulfitobacter undariae TaxID=1563671 RepID=A0A7W6EAZ7_9RHOB|nr:pyocin activator PrtN family protein [Sulfitobacter undariae]MBB3995280.1 Ni/Fe-hydrogenase subunit HybB-like protein [Sulfitobacter undariae]
MNTAFLLMAQYSGQAIIPADKVREDYFSHLTLPKFIRKISEGHLALPLVRMEASQKSAKGVHLQDLADYLDARRAEGQREFRQMYG